MLRAYPFAATFLPGHKLVVELSDNEPPADALLPPDAFHLPVGRPVTHKIYRDAAHPSRLLLPFTKSGAGEEQPFPRRPEGDAGGRVSVPGGTLRPNGPSERTTR